MAKHILESHRGNYFVAKGPSWRNHFHHEADITICEWVRLHEAHGEVFLFIARSGKDFLPDDLPGNYFSVLVRCLNPAASQKFSCTCSVNEQNATRGLTTGLTRILSVGNETIGCLSRNGDLFRIDEPQAAGLSRKQNPDVVTAYGPFSMRGRGLRIAFRIMKL
jgi:hypothetical protein